MRNYKFMIRAFLGAAAISTLVAACEDEQPPKKIASVTTPAPTTPEVRVETPEPAPTKVEPQKSEPVAVDEDKIDDENVDELLTDARDAMSTGELSHALKLARLATKKAPHRSAAFNTLGRVQLKRGEKKDAIASFEKAVELNPSSSYAENNLGLALIYDGKYDEAVDALEDATELEPVEPYMWNNLGMAYEHLDRLEEARDAYKQAVAAATGEEGGAVAKGNLTRLAGVKSVKPMQTAKIDTVKSDVTPTATPETEAAHVDGGTK
ncbi:MAG TPA: tetratricopeptide repeat protein [Polyangia bacterium]|jgi:Flp pilus assembly protein TadD